MILDFGLDMSGGGYHIDSEEAAWNSGAEMPGGNMGHRPAVKGGYFPVQPVDGTHEIRAHMCEVATEIGLGVEVHHHEVGTASQNEISFKFNTLTKGDEVQMIKYVIHNVAHNYGKTATFMPKPLVGDNGSGFRVTNRYLKARKMYLAMVVLAYPKKLYIISAV